MRIEKQKQIYKGSYIDGIKYDNYLFGYGDEFTNADTFVNAIDYRSAVNKIAKRLGLRTYSKSEIEDLNYDIQCGYIIVEESNYYDIESNETYQWYVNILY